NAFTPNGDGKNDEFKIIVNNPSGVTLISFQIYNRNGTLIFSTNKISEGWDGRYKGIVQDMGIYFVKLITSENGLDTRSIYLLK
ncbi:MAG: gliding motility-associated C-terminal domain-containing protein, partial [Chitinophagaceae bacterium]|nr:gliding motility-associated C-terminal domain-containing protein [Chitinophagaceae bacterium]MCF8422557.1 gliding motility-associated C-terminal domain-containing protein [Chitinophagaceae bacterium]